MQTPAPDHTRIIRKERDTARGPGPDVMAAGTLTGDRVYAADGDDVGRIKDIMLDVHSGRIAYAVLASGGTLGIGDKLLAIPWSAFTLDTRQRCLRLAVPAERIRDAPGFDPDHWPETADAQWAALPPHADDSAPDWNMDDDYDSEMDAPPHEASPDGPERGTERD
ncbi:PRC-barrel domain-containing protein [Burkholderia stagnalis]|uniref:PRC-barrel domain-containing protein n=1 Tax=Burkholderia stagnalis TaxID=1503054 RepID=UPI000757130C|nr:PRC-barrel domain-containing protein [Burkholderia stagnalis]KVC57889.1 photosystem reaction center subunit H [Burkholderia stagnalis]KVN19268.1 photosystem reaction center subunit H [Burkholderia stagnalis]KWI67508.1 photosystem reaction center subunit H [Burkholderia stagnalis]KWK39315.1 photosystem reaction center subunit H [Burkholderia stagnalis]KWK61607.1 photosystem reaction center subunit H [Burkholderia stagnalis]